MVYTDSFINDSAGNLKAWLIFFGKVLWFTTASQDCRSLKNLELLLTPGQNFCQDQAVSRPVRCGLVHASLGRKRAFLTSCTRKQSASADRVWPFLVFLWQVSAVRIALITLWCDVGIGGVANIQKSRLRAVYAPRTNETSSPVSTVGRCDDSKWKVLHPPTGNKQHREGGATPIAVPFTSGPVFTVVTFCTALTLLWPGPNYCNYRSAALITTGSFGWNLAQETINGNVPSTHACEKQRCERAGVSEHQTVGLDSITVSQTRSPICR